MKDCKGKVLNLGDSVIVPDPDPDDMWNHEFTGSVKSFTPEYVVVEDCDGDSFCVESERLEYYDEEEDLNNFFEQMESLSKMADQSSLVSTLAIQANIYVTKYS